MRKRFDFWVWMVQKDAIFIKIACLLRGISNLWGIRDLKWLLRGDRIIKERKVVGGRIFIALNGPSINKQPLEKIKGTGTDLIFVNQGFRLPSYRELHPKYHIFIDTKLIHGVWDIHWLDEILEMVPDITFVFPAEWARNRLFAPYIKRGVPIIWIRVRHSHGVSAAAFSLAMRLGYKDIYFSGYEGTAFACSLVKQSSHFYGIDSDEANIPPENIMKGYLMNADHFRCAINTAREAKRKGVNLINLTEGGIMDMFTRLKFDSVFP